MKMTLKGRHCPPGDESCRKGEHAHGLNWGILLQRPSAPDMVRTSDGVLRPKPKFGFRFDYWSRRADTESMIPSTYDVVSYISFVVSLPIDPDAVVDELGPMRPSAALAYAALSKRFHEFLTSEEILGLQKV